MLGLIILNVVMLSVVTLSVVALYSPPKGSSMKNRALGIDGTGHSSLAFSADRLVSECLVSYSQHLLTNGPNKVECLPLASLSSPA